MASKNDCYKYTRVILIGDDFGVSQLLDYVPKELIVGIIAAKNRPAYHKSLQKMADNLSVPLIVQPYFQSADYKGFHDSVKIIKADLIICNSYSMIVREDILGLVNGHAVNVHAALLPKNRGPNPIQWAIIKGEEKTGVTLHVMTNEVDAGDIIGQCEVDIAFSDTWVTLSEKLQSLGLTLLDTFLLDFLCGKLSAKSQVVEQSSTNKRLNADSPLICFEKMSDQQVYDLIRAQVYPLKGAFINTNAGKIHFDRIISLDEIKKLRTQYSQKAIT